MRKLRFNLVFLYSSENHFRLDDSKQNRCMNFLVVKQPCDILVSLSEVYVKILVNQIVLISNFPGKYDLAKFDSTKHDLFILKSSFIRCFYFDVCKLLRLSGFIHIHKHFAPNVDYLTETFKIINKSYLDYCVKSLLNKK